MIRDLWTRFTCWLRHDEYDFNWVRNIYGDEINSAGGNRSIWQCRKCRNEVLRKKLNPYHQ